ncbi:MAG: amino acid adenylation domain-containing protein [Calditrichaceae bacterium]
MSNISKRLEDLSPEKLEILRRKLQSGNKHINHQDTIPRRSNLSVYPISFAQKRLWFLDQLSPLNPFYNIPAALRLEGPLNVKALKSGINRILRRHEILRSYFITENGNPVQKIETSLTIIPDTTDLRDMSAKDQDKKVIELAKSEARTAFSLSKPPLLRIRLIQLKPDEHILLITLHHIIADGWSLGVFLRELSALYDSEISGIEADLPDLAVDYADYAAWQESGLNSDKIKKQLEFWNDQLSGMPHFLEIPADYQRTTIQSFSGHHHHFNIPADLTIKLRALSGGESSTLFITMMAAFQTLLYRYSGQRDFGVGIPIANRNRKETENLIGFFVNTLVLRADFHDNPSFSDLINRVKSRAIDAYDNQDLPFEKLVETMLPERDLSYNPLFQVMFQLEGDPLAEMRFANLKLSRIDFETGAAKFDLLMMLEEKDDYLLGNLEYNCGLFKSETIERMVSHYIELLMNIVKSPHAPVSTLNMITDAEKDEILLKCNSGTLDFSTESNIPKKFEEQVQRSPGSIAIYYKNEKISYFELNRKANQLAHYLINRGTAAESIIGILMDRSVDMIVSMMAVWKAGGAYLPLDASYPADRISYILNDANVSILITHNSIDKNLFPEDLPVLSLDEKWDIFAEENDTNPVLTIDSSNLAYLIYTSGSTGRPKGAMIQHRSALNLAANLFETVYASFDGESLRVSLNAPIAFDASIQQILTLTFGHSIFIIPQDIRADGERLVSFIKKNRLDVLDCVPSQLKLLILSGLFDGSGWKPLAVLPGGEAIDENTWQKLHQFRDTKFYNMYGPTECTVDSTMFPVVPTSEKPTIGRPVANAKFYILDSWMNSVPTGIPGELFIGGEGVGRGYYKKAALTAEKFIPDPFSKNAGSRMYRTGDRVRLLNDGTVEFLGRLDHQVKVRGFRIELGEIEYNLRIHPDIQEAVVITSTGGNLTGYFIPKKDKNPSPEALRDFLLQSLPDYMVPSVLMKLDKFPLTPNGKIDRNALPDPYHTYTDSAENIPPQNSLEKYLFAAWEQVLERTPAGIHQNFFEFGGNSLQAAVLINRIQEELHESLSVRTAFLYPTIHQYAAYLSRQFEKTTERLFGIEINSFYTSNSENDRPVDQSEKYSVIRPASKKSTPVLSFAQERLWFIDQFEPGNHNYNIAAAIRLTGKLDKRTLLKSIRITASRHDILRSAFQTIDGIAHLRVHDQINIELPETDLSTNPEKEKIAFEILETEAQFSFDLSVVPLFRTKLIKLREDQHIFFWNMHHIISDGWSMEVLMKEINALYNAYLKNESPELPELDIQYSDFAVWQKEWMSKDRIKLEINFWKEQLHGASTLLELPADRSRKAVQSFRGNVIHFSLPMELSDKIRLFSRKTEATPFMILLSVFQVILHRYSGQNTILVGTPVANRNHREIENLIGFFVNTLILRGDFADNPTFTEYLNRIKQTTLNVLAHQDIPFEKIVDGLEIERSLSHSPIFQVMFAYQQQSVQSLNLRDLNIEPIEINTRTSKFDLTLNITDNNGHLDCGWEYCTDLFDETTISRMHNHFINVLTAVIDQPERKISTYPLLSAADYEKIIHRWNNLPGDYPRDVTIHNYFELQAEKTPDTTALVFEDSCLTYREVNERANQIANHLIKKGAGPEQFIGLSVQRSIEMVTGILGILKSGAAYVPLDPYYPRERLAFAIEDCCIKYILTQDRFLNGFPGTGTELISFESNSKDFATESTANPKTDVCELNLAYVIFTSGSTGRPKGVPIQHRSVINLALAYQKKFNIHKDRRVIQFFSYSFDGSVADIFTALTSGATLYLTSQDSMLPGEGFVKLMKKSRITNAVLPPSVLSVVDSTQFSDLDTLASGGDVCTREIVDRWSSGRNFYNAYGPTETTVAASWYLTEKMPADRTNIPIGRPLPNYRIYILDKELKPVPEGIPGEMHIGGEGLARGYLKKPDLTAGKFIPDPFNPDAGSRMYKSGDLTRFLPDGNIEFLGRIDNQVKIRGYRIELGEIESALLFHDEVEEAIVMSKEVAGNKQLIAYIVPARRDKVNAEQLRTHLKSTMPDYMIPSAFMFLDRMPVAATGKVDRKALPEPEIKRSDLKTGYTAPGSRNEEILVNIWQELLGIDKIGVKDNFFELGGDSILSIQAIARAKNAGLILSPKQLFENPTIEFLASVSETKKEIITEQGLVTGTAELSPIQKWFFEQDFSENHHWNQSVLLIVKDSLNTEYLNEIFGELIRHHDALRLKIATGKSKFLQKYSDIPKNIPFSVIDLTNLPADLQTGRLADECHKLQGDHNLSTGPLIRAAYFKMDPSHSDRLFITIHQLAVDGKSWRILLEDLDSAYKLRQSGRTIELPTKTTPYKIWTESLKKFANAQIIKQETPYWQNQLSGEKQRVPVDFPDGKNSESSTKRLSLVLEAQQTQKLLKSVPSLYNTQIHENLLTAIFRAYAKWTGKHHLFVQLEGHGREDLFDDVDLSRTVGWFTSAYPLSLSMNGTVHIQDTLKTVKEQMRMIPNRGIGFGLLRYLCDDMTIRKQLKSAPVPDISFNYLGQFGLQDSGHLFNGIDPNTGAERSPKAKRTHLLDISGTIVNKSLNISVDYSSDLIKDETIRLFLNNIMDELQQLIDHCEKTAAGDYTPSDFLDVNLDQEEIDKMLSELNDNLEE